MPALVNISVGSSFTTMGAEGTMVCPFCSKNFLNELRISFAVIFFVTFVDLLFFGRKDTTIN
jgi:hypothetical protein